MSDMHHAIYIPAPENIDGCKTFTAITFSGDSPEKKRFAWGSNRKEGETKVDAIKNQKAGYTQIAGDSGTGNKILLRMQSKARNTRRRNNGYSVHNKIIYHSRQGGALKHITNPDTVLYIDSHGNSLNMGFRPYGHSPEELAKLMKYEQLPKTIKKIKLLACYSGEEADTKKGKRKGDIYARQFSAFMYKFGYKGLTTYGYLGEIIVMSNGTRVSDTILEDEDDDYVKASAARRTFVAGKEVKG
jgi:hypothetical protein